MTYTFASATVLLLLICDPLGNIPIFANALRHVAPERRARVILREVLIAFALLVALRVVFRWIRFGRFVANPPLAEAGIYVCLLALVVVLL